MSDIVLHVARAKTHPGWALEEFEFNRERKTPIGPDGDLDARSEPGVTALCLLIVHTAIARFTSPKNAQPPVPEKYRPTLRTLWASKSEKGLGWQRKIFGENPFERLLCTSGSRNTFELWFRPTVDVEVISSDTDRTLAHGELVTLAKQLSTRSNDPDHLTIEIKTDSNTVSSVTETGSLTKFCKIQILVQRNFGKGICVFWIDSEDRISELHPKLEIPVEGDAYVETTSSAGSTLEIPATGRLEVNSPPGLETCVILVAGAPLAQGAVDNLRSLLDEMRPLRDSKLRLSQPQFRSFGLNSKRSAKKRNLLRRRLDEVTQPDNWEKQLISRLEGLAERIYFFHIPNI